MIPVGFEVDVALHHLSSNKVAITIGSMPVQEGAHMSAKILDGKAIAQQIRAETTEKVAAFTRQTDIVPKLAAVLVGEDPASQVYVRNKERACKKAGIASEAYRIPDSTTQTELLELISKLNADKSVNGILVQLPLPKQIDEQALLDAVDARKDVDAFHPENVGRMSQGRPRFLPCTPHGVQQLLHRYDIPTSGKHVVVVGRSEIVGKPIASMLAQKDSGMGPDAANATVTICHSRTKDLGAVTKSADILIAAIGKPKFISAGMIKPGAVVVDVGINRTEEGLVGDVDFDGAIGVASYVTPVPGGVGPLTIAMLLENTFAACQLQNS